MISNIHMCLKVGKEFLESIFPWSSEIVDLEDWSVSVGQQCVFELDFSPQNLLMSQEISPWVMSAVIAQVCHPH